MSTTIMLVHSIRITAAIFLYMALFGHKLPSLSPQGPLLSKDMDGILMMLKHSLILGFGVFIYMGMFGHNSPMNGFQGPFFKE